MAENCATIRSLFSHFHSVSFIYFGTRHHSFGTSLHQMPFHFLHPHTNNNPRRRMEKKQQAKIICVKYQCLYFYFCEMNNRQFKQQECVTGKFLMKFSKLISRIYIYNTCDGMCEYVRVILS